MTCSHMLLYLISNLKTLVFVKNLQFIIESQQELTLTKVFTKLQNITIYCTYFIQFTHK